jgi:intein/homing endonuclease
MFDPNPLFYKMVLAYTQARNLGKCLTICNEGGTRCFSENQEIITATGNKKISEIKTGDLVYSMDEKTKTYNYKPVKNVFKFNNNKKSIRLTLKSGEIIECTEDHEFYFEGGWYSLKYLLSLKEKRHGNMEINTRI